MNNEQLAIWGVQWRVWLVFWSGLFFGGSILGQTNPCLEETAFHFVILGSSTAAGSGVSNFDSAWVNRYRHYLQDINPENEVTNLALGGYSTYRLMPSDFLPPANRPNPDVERNITKAISLAPDAVIINLPSNDVSAGFSVAEQLSNFDTIFQEAQNANIPLWICTTQPKNYGGNQILIQRQLDVRDSILLKFAPNTLDFWTGLADSTNQIDSFYDSGDGTHLNDAGHALLFNRVQNAEIPIQLLDITNAPDFSPANLSFIQPPDCGISEAILQIETLNLGSFSTDSVFLNVTLTHLTTGENTNYTDYLSPPFGTCELDSSFFSISTEERGFHTLIAIISNNFDINPQNDTLQETIFFEGIPYLQIAPDTGCINQSFLLNVDAHPDDSIRWFDSINGQDLIAMGATFNTPPLSSTTTYYAQAFRGPFFQVDSLSSATTSSINWNGTMFDLVADTLLILDSIALNVHTLGLQNVEVFTKQGSHLGFETNPTAWEFQDDYPVFVTDSFGLKNIPLANIALEKGDTLGIYLQLNNPSSTLGYQSLNSPIEVSDGQLRIRGGSGIDHNFGGSYFPRFWKGKVFYHFAEMPDGSCTTDLEPVEIQIQEPMIELGNDTILNITDHIVLNGGNFVDYEWSDGSTNSSLTLSGVDLGTGIYPISLIATDDFGCEATDEIIIVFAPLVHTVEIEHTLVKVFPNPASDLLNFEIAEGSWNIFIYNSLGILVKNEQLVPNANLAYPMNIEDLSTGLYFLKLEPLDRSKTSPTKLINIFIE